MEIVLPSHRHFTEAWAGGCVGAGPGNRYRTAPRHVPPSSRYGFIKVSRRPIPKCPIVPPQSVPSSHPRVSHRPPQSVPSHPRVSLSHLFWSQDRPIVPPNFLHPIVPSIFNNRPISENRSSHRPISENTIVPSSHLRAT